MLMVVTVFVEALAEEAFFSSVDGITLSWVASSRPPPESYVQTEIFTSPDCLIVQGGVDHILQANSYRISR